MNEEQYERELELLSDEIERAIGLVAGNSTILNTDDVVEVLQHLTEYYESKGDN